MAHLVEVSQSLVQMQREADSMKHVPRVTNSTLIRQEKREGLDPEMEENIAYVYSLTSFMYMEPITSFSWQYVPGFVFNVSLLVCNFIRFAAMGANSSLICVVTKRGASNPEMGTLPGGRHLCNSALYWQRLAQKALSSLFPMDHDMSGTLLKCHDCTTLLFLN